MWLFYTSSFIILALILVVVLININTVPLVKEIKFECNAVNTLLRYILFFQFITLALLVLNKAELYLDYGMVFSGLSTLAYEYLSILFHLTISVALNGYLRLVRENTDKYKRVRKGLRK